MTFSILPNRVFIMYVSFHIGRICSPLDGSIIAPYVGFCTQSHFGKMFRRHTGMTQLTYRNATQK